MYKYINLKEIENFTFNNSFYDFLKTIESVEEIEGIQKLNSLIILEKSNNKMTKSFVLEHLFKNEANIKNIYNKMYKELENSIINNNIYELSYRFQIGKHLHNVNNLNLFNNLEIFKILDIFSVFEVTPKINFDITNIVSNILFETLHYKTYTLHNCLGQLKYLKYFLDKIDLNNEDFFSYINQNINYIEDKIEEEIDLSIRNINSQKNIKEHLYLMSR